MTLAEPMPLGPRLPMPKAVIFDMDGVVLDSEPSYVFAWRQAAAEFGVALEDEFARGLFGRHADDVACALAEKIGAGFEPGRFRQSAVRFWTDYVDAHGIAPMPGVDELLAALDRQRIPYALATNSDGPYAKECLRLGGLEQHFGCVVTRDQVAVGKPAPDVFLEAARRVGVPATECLVLEDSATGLLAARRAGATPVLVLAHPAPEEAKSLAAANFQSLADVARAFGEVWRQP